MSVCVVAGSPSDEARFERFFLGRGVTIAAIYVRT